MFFKALMGPFHNKIPPSDQIVAKKVWEKFATKSSEGGILGNKGDDSLVPRKENMTREKLSTGPFSASKKSGMKREGSPCTPSKRKARGKENNPGALSTGLSTGAYADACERIRAREAMRKQSVDAAVKTALAAFGGTRRNPFFDREPWKDPCDERLWANFAWEFGYGKLLDLIDQAEAEIAEHRRPVADRDKPKILQALITPFWKRGAK